MRNRTSPLKFSNDTELIGGVQGVYPVSSVAGWWAVKATSILQKTSIILLALVAALGWALGSWLLYGTGSMA